jgi:tetratricopeptide (TPR) repeat protein
MNPAPPAIPHPLADDQAARAWFEAEHACLLAAQHTALEQGCHGHAWQLARSMDVFLYENGLLSNIVSTWQIGLAAAQQENDAAAIGLAHRTLSHFYSLISRHTDAIRHANLALALARDANDPLATAHSHYYLAVAWMRQDDDQRVLEHATIALRLFHDLDDEPRPKAELHALIGWTCTRVGLYEQAAAHLQEALTQFRLQAMDVAGVLFGLGYLAHNTGRYQDAFDYYQQSLIQNRQFNNSVAEAEVLHRIGDTHAAVDHPDQARQAWQQALHLYQIQHRVPEAQRVRQQLADVANEQTP